MAPGLLVVYSGIKPSSSLTAAKYHDWYNEHLRDILALDDGGRGASSALRYTLLAAPTQERLERYPYLALYPLADAEHVLSEAFLRRPMKGEFEDIDFDARVYQEIQRFVPGTGERAEGKRGQCVVLVGMTPGGGDEGERDWEDWYKKQHLDMLSMCRGYLRTTRYKMLEKHTKSLNPGQELDAAKHPKYLAIHEYETKDLPTDQIKQTTSTEWSKKIIGECKTFNREVGELLHEEVVGGAALASL